MWCEFSEILQSSWWSGREYGLLGLEMLKRNMREIWMLQTNEARACYPGNVHVNFYYTFNQWYLSCSVLIRTAQCFLQGGIESVQSFVQFRALCNAGILHTIGICWINGKQWSRFDNWTRFHNFSINIPIYLFLNLLWGLTWRKGLFHPKAEVHWFAFTVVHRKTSGFVVDR